MLKWHSVILDKPRNNQNIPQTAGQNLFIAYSGEMMVATVTGKDGEDWHISFPSQNYIRQMPKNKIYKTKEDAIQEVKKYWEGFLILANLKEAG